MVRQNAMVTRPLDLQEIGVEALLLYRSSRLERETQLFVSKCMPQPPRPSQTQSVEMPAGHRLSLLAMCHQFIQDAHALSWKFFSGSCRLSKTCKSVGFRVAAVDKDVNRSENFPIYQCDITNSNERELLFQYVEAEDADLLHCHFAPSCGTASRAREKAPGPPPLRSDEHPDGLPNLKPHDKLRVEAANASYVAMVDLARFLVSRGCSISIENPKNSLFWKCTFIVAFLQSLPTYHVSGHW